MGRRKQSKPRRSVGSITQANGESDEKEVAVAEGSGQKDFVDIDKPYYVNICSTHPVSEQHLDISEVVLMNLSLRERFCSCRSLDDVFQCPDYSLRFRVCNVSQFVDRIKLGHWPVLSSGDVTLELIDKKVSDDAEADSVVWSAGFDGPGEGVSGLVHLSSLEFLTLRLLPGLQGLSSPRVRVEMLQKAFDSCDSLLDNTRQVWKKSMMNVIFWLRPEMMTSEVRYGTKLNATETEMSQVTEAETSHSNKQPRFDVAAFYEAIKPSKMDATLGDDIPDLLPALRPYQRRAAYWMVQREKGDPVQLTEEESPFSPLCIPVGFLDSTSKMFYNPFSGNISLVPEYFSPQILGGILADEMGLGKTVELLACIFSNRKPAKDGISESNISSVPDEQKISLKRLKRERVECICGAVSESRKYKGMWVQCDICDAWQHADCVGYSPKGKVKKHNQDIDGKVSPKRRKEGPMKIEVREGEYTCKMCSELLQVTVSPIPTGATLIVCPAPILPQWHSEITRHTRLGSLVTCVYEGVRSASLSEAPMVDISELVNADIILTTYDVLKEDLSHDFDRHDGDRHVLRFQKRYPVIPTPLTRIFWWRICLDEAQMVESNAAAATEMALRLYTKHRWCITGTPIQRKLDDLYGLLRFLKASPFDVSRWWSEVIRDPYERQDTKAMDFTHKIFKQIMWRSSKLHVADELQIPPQEECVSWLTFSAIEEHFYSRQHETCVSYAREVIETLKQDILKRGQKFSDNPLITHTEAAKLLNSLLKLRQACCHPQVGSSGLRSLQQTPMTMEEILMVLVKKTQTEGEEALRTLIVALNGLAAVAMLKLEFSQAVGLYNEALNITNQHSEDFRLDPLLNIHILHNLAEILPTVKSYEGKVPALGSLKKAVDSADDDQNSAKRQRVNEPENLGPVPQRTAQHCASCVPENGLKEDEECQALKLGCQTLKAKYLSGFYSKLSAAQQEGLGKTVELLACIFSNRKPAKDGISESNISSVPDEQKISLKRLKRERVECICGAVSESRKYKGMWVQCDICDAWQHADCVGYSPKGKVKKHNQDIDGKVSPKRRKEGPMKIEICDALSDMGKQHSNWWLDALQLAGQNKDFAAELTRKIEEAIHGNLNNSSSSRTTSHFRTIHGMKFHLQTFMDTLEGSRKRVIDRLLEIDQTMEKPNIEDIERITNCKYCQKKDDGPLCLHCELDELFQEYEARLFRLNRSRRGVMESASVEEMVDMQKKKSALNLFFSGLSSRNKDLNSSNDGDTEPTKRNSGDIVIVSKSPSEMEIALGVIRTHCKTYLDREGKLTATKHMQMLEWMRKEYAHARALSRAQAQLLRAYDEIKMATMRLQLREFEDDTQIYALSLDELDAASVQNTNDKFLALSSLLSTKGKFRYLKELMKSKQKQESEIPDQQSSLTPEVKVPSSIEQKSEGLLKPEEACPICHENLWNQKMVFQCGHTTCCKCFFAMTESRSGHDTQQKWVMCPICRQHTDVGNIAYADDRRNNGFNSSTDEDYKEDEASFVVQGSYGTKVEAVTRRILWIKSTDPEAKVLVFSSWNDVLDVLEHAFTGNGITFIRMKGGRKSQTAISKFRGETQNQKRNPHKKEPRSIQVLLLLIQHGANGLNLLEAQHVIMVEPLLNPAAEAQAVSRVHRIGQDKPTLVHRFLVKGTVEESIYKLNTSRNVNSSSNSFISGNTKNQDQPFLTLRDLESLFSSTSAPDTGDNWDQTNLRDLPPSVAAAMAAERRLTENAAASSSTLS
ncbi:PREDICTED: E3 ubiquitin-protein ligase SHPRH [Tarenaya hassleriana]|uniref:E3 ubiquitin-protein ligase SHPRH n=1 Tax=Tarenaya hassleriana TaxID=28532 RepID=UPI00053C6B1E|nr:PREDICTED: E3 ubiquitin-protein ligase SHPRH [Tarenaya hassleriana]